MKTNRGEVSELAVESIIADGMVDGIELSLTEDGRGRYRIYTDGKASRPFTSVLRAGLAFDYIATFAK